jgi:hypothetical protein
MALVLVVRHWKPYLWGRPFVIHTDHFSLTFLLDQKIATIPQHQWVSKLLGFDFTIEYKPGTTNTIADSTLRSALTFQLFDDLHAELDSDTALRTLKEEVIQGLHGDK